MLRYKTETRPGLVALYDIRPGNGAGQFLLPSMFRTLSGSPNVTVCSCVGLGIGNRVTVRNRV